MTLGATLNLFIFWEMSSVRTKFLLPVWIIFGPDEPCLRWIWIKFVSPWGDDDKKTNDQGFHLYRDAWHLVVMQSQSPRTDVAPLAAAAWALPSCQTFNSCLYSPHVRIQSQLELRIRTWNFRILKHDRFWHEDRCPRPSTLCGMR